MTSPSCADRLPGFPIRNVSDGAAIEDVDVVIIATDWPQFRSVTEYLIKKENNKPLIMDGRRMLQQRYDDLQQVGYNIIAVGSPFIKGKNIEKN